MGLDPDTDTDTQNTLDQAYDEGGAGVGRTITADNGAVDIAGAGGLTVNGNVGIGTTSPAEEVDIDLGVNGSVRMRFDDGTSGFGEIQFFDDTSGNIKWANGVWSDGYTGTALQNAWWLGEGQGGIRSRIVPACCE